MKKPLLILTAIAALVMPAGAQSSNADPVGTWKWTTTRRNGDTSESQLQIKRQDAKLTGVMIRREGRETPISDIKVDGNQLTFTLTRERGDRRFVSQYKGKIDGDKITGTIESEFNGQTRSRDWIAQRTAKPAEVTGLWEYTFTMDNGQTFTPQLDLKQSGQEITGALLFGDNRIPLEKGRAQGGEVWFEVSPERDGREFIAKYHGKQSGDTIKGEVITVWEEERKWDWEAKRVKKIADASGLWEYTLTFGGGQSIDPQFRLTQNGQELTGTLTFRDDETPISNGKIDGDTIYFEVIRERNGNSFATKYSGKLDGDIIRGRTITNWNGEDREREWFANRLSK